MMLDHLDKADLQTFCLDRAFPGLPCMPVLSSYLNPVGLAMIGAFQHQLESGGYADIKLGEIDGHFPI